jgi:hypothetical protein
MSPFSAVSSDDMQAARIVTGATMVVFIGVGVVPGLRKHAGVIRGVLLVAYLLTCGAFAGYVLLR